MYNLEKIKAISRGNTQFVKKMIRVFINETEFAVQQMQEAYANKDYDKIRYVSHKLKPAIMNMGIESITDDILFLEAIKIDDGNFEKLPAVIGKTSDILGKVVARLQQELSEMV